MTDVRLLSPGDRFALPEPDGEPGAVYTLNTLRVQGERVVAECRGGQQVAFLLSEDLDVVHPVPAEPKLHSSFIPSTGEWVCSIEAEDTEHLLLDLNEGPIYGDDVLVVAKETQEKLRRLATRVARSLHDPAKELAQTVLNLLPPVEESEPWTPKPGDRAQVIPGGLSFFGHPLGGQLVTIGGAVQSSQAAAQGFVNVITDDSRGFLVHPSQLKPLD